MSEPRDGTERMDALEMRVAHQDRVIEDLNAAITAQWTQIDRMARHVASLGDQIKEAESRAASVVPSQKPPHY